MSLEQNYQNNMNLLKDGWPFVYNKILEADISQYELVETTNNEFNILVNGNKLYPENVDEAIDMQVEVFLKDPANYYKKPSWSQDGGYIHDKFIKSVEENSPYVKEKVPFTDYHHNLDGYIPLLVVFGIGSGKHIEKLIEKSNGITDIIIVDQSYEFLKISFHLIDWKKIFKYFYENHRGLQFVIDESHIQTSNELLNVIFKQYPYHFFNIQHFTHYDSNFFNNVKEEFLRKIDLGFSGLGFYDDEMISITNTLKNLKNNRAVYRWDKPLPKNSVAFILGSGPSLDNDIEQIKKHQDKAIIFSSGSSLSALYANDIVPDFHIVQERIGNFEYLAENLPSEYLKKIDVICLNVVEQETLALFKNAKMYFRENDAGASIVPENIHKVHHTNPTVVNAALGFTSTIGFKNIFLFGADMGFRNLESHHAKSSSYYKENAAKKRYKTDGRGYPGNFDRDEKFLSTETLMWCRQRAENCAIDFNIRRQKSINYFNCSDGLYIERFTPMRSSEFQIDKNLDKKEVLKSIDDNFDSNFEQLHQEIQITHEKAVDILFKDIQTIEKLTKAKKIKSFEQLFVLIKRTYLTLGYIDDEQTSHLTRSLLKGTLYHFYVSLYTHALAGTNKKESFEYINENIPKLLDFLELVKEQNKELLNNGVKVVDKSKEFKFLKTLNNVNEEKIKDMYCKDAIGFLATEENLEDEGFVNYIKELYARFPKVKFKVFYLDKEYLQLAKNIFQDALDRFKFIQPINIYNIAQNIEVWCECNQQAKEWMYNNGLFKKIGDTLFNDSQYIYRMIYNNKIADEIKYEDESLFKSSSLYDSIPDTIENKLLNRLSKPIEEKQYFEEYKVSTIGIFLDLNSLNNEGYIEYISSLANKYNSIKLFSIDGSEKIFFDKYKKLMSKCEFVELDDMSAIVKNCTIFIVDYATYNSNSFVYDLAEIIINKLSNVYVFTYREDYKKLTIKQYDIQNGCDNQYFNENSFFGISNEIKEKANCSYTCLMYGHIFNKITDTTFDIYNVDFEKNYFYFESYELIDIALNSKQFRNERNSFVKRMREYYV